VAAVPAVPNPCEGGSRRASHRLQPDSEIKNSPRTSNPPTDNGARNLGVISRFHTPVEQQCLRIFLQGPRIVICPARGLDRFLLPAEWQQKFKRGELLIVNPFDSISAFSLAKEDQVNDNA
jgi:hypothetical protein